MFALIKASIEAKVNGYTSLLRVRKKARIFCAMLKILTLIDGNHYYDDDDNDDDE